MSNIHIDFSKKGPQKKQQEIKKYTYIDIGTKNFLQQKDGTISTLNSSVFDKEAIKQSIQNILNFRTCESILLPQFGIGDLYALLYSPFDKYNIQKIGKTIADILQTWQPRIKLISTPTKYNQNTVQVEINYVITSINQNDTYMYVFKK